MNTFNNYIIILMSNKLHLDRGTITFFFFQSLFKLVINETMIRFKGMLERFKPFILYSFLFRTTHKLEF